MIFTTNHVSQIARARLLLHGELLSEQQPGTTFDATLTSLCPGRGRRAGMTADEYRRALTYCILLVAVLTVLSISTRLFVLLPIALTPFVVFFWLLDHRAMKRAENFERDYPAFLLSLGSAVRTGLDPIVAFCRVGELFHENGELRKCLYCSKEEMERGTPEDEVLKRFALSIPHPDINLFRTAFILSRKHGSSISSCLERLVRVTRQRQSFRRKISAAVALQKLSSIGILLCAVAIGCMQIMTNPAAFHDSLAHPMGIRMLAAGALLMFVGVGWMLRLTKRRI